MNGFDAFARAMTDLLDDIAAGTAGEHYGGPFARQSAPFHATAEAWAAQQAARADMVRRAAKHRLQTEENRRCADRQRQHEHDQTPPGRASEAAWRAYLAEPAAQRAYADYGFEVATAAPRDERFVLERRRPRGYGTGGLQVVASADHGDRVTAYTPDMESGMAGRFVLTWKDGNATILVDAGPWLKDESGRLVAMMLTPREGFMTATDLATFGRFLNGYEGGWIDLLEPGQTVTLLTLRQDGSERYREMRALFRAAWEARPTRPD